MTRPTRNHPDELVVGLVSISDRASQGVYEDKGIPSLETWLGEALATPWRTETRLIQDDAAIISATLIELADVIGCDLVLTTGGTGSARRDVTPELEAAMLDRFLAQRPELDREAFLADYRALAAANAARVLGRVFARQALLGRPQYRAYMPRTWRYLERNLQDPQLAGLKRWFDRHVPAEARA